MDTVSKVICPRCNHENLFIEGSPLKCQKCGRQLKLRMQYAGGLVKHLGHHMYTGATPAIAELVANAWDADASRVEIEIPFGEPWDHRSSISVRDNGIGMTFDECNDRFLLVGRDRRREIGDYTDNGRPVMGHKGIGKLGCFGIARRVEIRTVKDRWLTHFYLDYDDIMKASQGKLVSGYDPIILHDERMDGSVPDGTVVTLKRIQLELAINEDRFRDSMARRFAVLSHEFEVWINEKRLEPYELEYEFRFPEEEEYYLDSVPGLGPVKWWVGFTPKPVKYEDARGIAVMVRGRLAQEPFFFNIKGGVTGQHGMQYMVGEVHADSLDDGDADLVSTGRASVMWEHSKADPLLKWGEGKVRELLSEWARRRSHKRIERVRDRTKYSNRIDKFPDRERREITKAIEKLAGIEDISQERLDELVEFLLKAYENEYFMNLIRELNAMDDATQESILQLFAEWDVLEAVHIAQIVRGRVEIIRQFRRMVEAGVREKPDMQDFLKEHPWLLDLAWSNLRHEKSLDTILEEEFHRPKTGEEEGHRRLDFFCLAGAGVQVVVELKRPGKEVGSKELEQLERYVDFLKVHGSSSEPKYQTSIHGQLIASELDQLAYHKRDRMKQDNMYFVTWDNLLLQAEQFHREYLELVKSRAPADDPRILALEHVDDGAKEEVA